MSNQSTQLARSKCVADFLRRFDDGLSIILIRVLSIIVTTLTSYERAFQWRSS